MPGDPNAVARHDQKGLRTDQALDHPRANACLGFEAALAILGGEGGTDQSQPWSSAGFAVERDRQIAQLTDWSTDERLWIPVVDLGQRNSGRMEHAIFGERIAGEYVFKATKGPKFGFWPQFDSSVVSTRFDEFLVMRPATPTQYFTRLLLLESLYMDLNRLQGFSILDGHFSIITSQPWYACRNATWAEIKAWMKQRGFIPVRADIYDDPTRWYHPEQNLALFDVGESNIIHSDGELVPIDIIPMQPDGPLLDFLTDFSSKQS